MVGELLIYNFINFNIILKNYLRLEIQVTEEPLEYYFIL
jgi:hypothetical protein